MKYRHNHPSKDLAAALDLSKKAKERLDAAISKAYNSPVTSVDDINNIVAPYIHTTEEAFYAAMIICTDVQAAKLEVMAKTN